MTRTEALRKVKEAEEALKAAQRSVAVAEADCKARHYGKHDWGPVRDTSFTKPGFRVEGDPPGTMGVDRREAFYAPSERVPQATRTCRDCGLEETTNHFAEEKVVTHKPVFGGG